MRNHVASWLMASSLILVGLGGPAFGAEAAFSYKTSYRNVTQDPDKIWTGAALAAGPNGTVTIHEYELRTSQGDLVVSQIWNENCAAATCPTRLVRIAPHKEPVVLVDDMMHQIIPPNDPRFAAMAANKTAAAFARHPFKLASDGKTLVNGDLNFPIGESKP